MSYISFFSRKFTEYIRDFTALANPFILILVSLLFIGPGEKFLLLLLGLAINEALCSLIKYIFPKMRPNRQKFSNSLEKIDAASFPSIHSSRVMFVYLTLFFHTLSVLRILFMIIIALVGFSRIHLKKHYIIDVFGGYLFGLALYYAYWSFI